VADPSEFVKQEGDEREPREPVELEHRPVAGKAGAEAHDPRDRLEQDEYEDAVVDEPRVRLEAVDEADDALPEHTYDTDGSLLSVAPGRPPTPTPTTDDR
jgi:hypothetical protein